MVSVADLLNPAPSPEPPRVPLPASRPAPIPPPARRTVSFRDEPNHARPSIDTLRMAEHVKNSARCKPKGVVNFPPFEALDEGSLREVRRFQVYPFGSIQDTCRRIPYNSGKKDFFTKTGREFFEVFQYEFKVPGDDISYTVMWDYSVGLVRMTPFFKCLGYSKTTPAKMLSQNPGLKDVTYSITGGAIKAQGYWMPFSCAKAVCATFCHKIAGALIPLFGPRFPSECVHEKATGHGRMVIDPEIVARAKRDAAALFGPRTTALPSPRASRSASPHPLSLSKPYESPADYQRGVLLSPYGTDTDLDYHPGPYPAVPPLRTAGRPPSAAPTLTPLHSPGWTAVNQRHPPVHPYYPRSAAAQVNDEHPWNAGPTANPWLSAVPRSPTPATSSRHEQQQRPRPYHARFHYQTSSSSRFFDGPTLPPLRGGKRGYEQVDETAIDNKHGNDEEYDAGESHAGSSSSPLTAVSDEQEPHHDHHVKKEDAKAGPEPAVASTKTAARATAAAETATPTSPEPRTPSVGQSSLDHPESTSSRSPLHAAVRVGVSSPGPEAVNRNRNPARDDSGHNQARRPAAERDAAIMLMHMMRGQDDDDDDNDNNTTNNSNSRDGGARAISQGQGQGCHHGQSEGDASPATCVSSVGVGASAIASARPAVVPTPSPPAPSTVHHHHTRTAAAAAAASSSPPGAGGGPCTRAKRRRTLM